MSKLRNREARLRPPRMIQIQLKVVVQENQKNIYFLPVSDMINFDSIDSSVWQITIKQTFSDMMKFFFFIVFFHIFSNVYKRMLILLILLYDRLCH